MYVSFGRPSHKSTWAHVHAPVPAQAVCTNSRQSKAGPTNKPAAEVRRHGQPSLTASHDARAPLPRKQTASRSNDEAQMGQCAAAVAAAAAMRHTQTMVCASQQLSKSIHQCRQHALPPLPRQAPQRRRPASRVYTPEHTLLALLPCCHLQQRGSSSPHNYVKGSAASAPPRRQPLPCRGKANHSFRPTEPPRSAHAGSTDSLSLPQLAGAPGTPHRPPQRVRSGRAHGAAQRERLLPQHGQARQQPVGAVLGLGPPLIVHVHKRTLHLGQRLNLHTQSAQTHNACAWLACRCAARRLIRLVVGSGPTGAMRGAPTTAPTDPERARGHVKARPLRPTSRPPSLPIVTRTRCCRLRLMSCTSLSVKVTGITTCAQQAPPRIHPLSPLPPAQIPPPASPMQAPHLGLHHEASAKVVRPARMATRAGTIAHLLPHASRARVAEAGSCCPRCLRPVQLTPRGVAVSRVQIGTHAATHSPATAP